MSLTRYTLCSFGLPKNIESSRKTFILADISQIKMAQRLGTQNPVPSFTHKQFNFRARKVVFQHLRSVIGA